MLSLMGFIGYGAMDGMNYMTWQEPGGRGLPGDPAFQSNPQAIASGVSEVELGSEIALGRPACA
jgi:hypothetical protein